MDHNDIPNRFSIGFPIDLERMEVALVRKKRGPVFNVGRLNGCGGHIKIGESAVGAMRREANEELGLWLPASGQWQQFHYERRIGNGNCLSFFVANVPDVRNKAKKMTDEDVEIIMIEGLLSRMAGQTYMGGDGKNSIRSIGKEHSDFVYNLGYLIPMAVCWLLNPEHAYTGA